MQALVFDTKIFQNGVIKIPELSNWKDSEVSIIVIKKPLKNTRTQNITKKNESYDCTKVLAEFNRVRQVKIGEAEVLTMDRAINIYDGITSISG
jgi:hypothetical protein